MNEHNNSVRIQFVEHIKFVSMKNGKIDQNNLNCEYWILKLGNRSFSVSTARYLVQWHQNAVYLSILFPSLTYSLLFPSTILNTSTQITLFYLFGSIVSDNHRVSRANDLHCDNVHDKVELHVFAVSPYLSFSVYRPRTRARIHTQLTG